MTQSHPQPPKSSKKMYFQAPGPQRTDRQRRSARQSDPPGARSRKNADRELPAAVRPTDDNLLSNMNIQASSPAMPTESLCAGKPPSGRSSAGKADPKPPRIKRPRLPTLQEVLDAFDPMDDCLEPVPEPGDFWFDPDR